MESMTEHMEGFVTGQVYQSVHVCVFNAPWILPSYMRDLLCTLYVGRMLQKESAEFFMQA